MGAKILRHSIWLVLSHWREALRISLLLYIPTVLFFVFLLPKVEALSAGGGESGDWLIVFGSLAITAFTFYWTAVGWHRFVLLDETTDALLPPFQGGRMLAYFGWTILLSVIVAFIALIVSLVVGFIMGMLMTIAAGAPVVGFIVVILGTILIYAVVITVFYRLSPILPATAIGQKLSIGQAWKATKGSNGAIAVLALLSAVILVVIGLPPYLFVRMPFGGALNTVWTVIASWLQLMVGISIMTTLYGCYVEKRSIS